MPRRHIYFSSAPGGPWTRRSPYILEQARDAVTDKLYDWSTAVTGYFSPALEPESNEPYPGQKEGMDLPRLIVVPVRWDDKFDFREVTHYLKYYEPGFSEKLRDAKGQTEVQKLLNKYGFVWQYGTTYKLDLDAYDMLYARKEGLRKPIPGPTVVEHYDNL